MKLELKEVDRHNLGAVLKLAVAEGQKGFVAPNVVSMAQARVYPAYLPRAICAGGAPVGFALYGPDDEDGDRWWLVRLMVDAAHQGQGYGRAAMALVIAEAGAAGQDALFLSVEPENAAAIGLYQSLGFAFDGRVQEGERVMRLAL